MGNWIYISRALVGAGGMGAFAPFEIWQRVPGTCSDKGAFEIWQRVPGTCSDKGAIILNSIKMLQN